MVFEVYEYIEYMPCQIFTFYIFLNIKSKTRQLFNNNCLVLKLFHNVKLNIQKNFIKKLKIKNSSKKDIYSSKKDIYSSC